MNLETARTLLPLFRQGKQMSDRVVKAVRLAESNDDMRAELGEQMDFDDYFVEAIHGIQPPPSFRERLTSTTAKPRSRTRQATNPAILCAVFGILVFAGILIFLNHQANEDFPGRDRLESFIERNEREHGTDLERTQLKAGQLADNMMLQGFDGFALPPEVAPLQASGWGVFRDKNSGHKIAKLAIEKNNLIVFVFRTADFGTHPGKPSEWRVFSHEGWAAAVTEHGNLCTLLTFKGDSAAMESFLTNLKP